MMVVVMINCLSISGVPLLGFVCLFAVLLLFWFGLGDIGRCGFCCCCLFFVFAFFNWGGGGGHTVDLELLIADS